MPSLDQPALEDLVSKAVCNVFRKMLSIKLEPIDPACTLTNPANDGDQLVGSVGFAGKANGVICIHLTESFARLILSSLLSLRPEEVSNIAAVNDAVGELSNMVGGNLKSSLCDSGFSCQLSIPSITRGNRLQIQPTGETIRAYLGFSYQQHYLLVEVYLKTRL